jgi:hypothetical protein
MCKCEQPQVLEFSLLCEDAHSVKVGLLPQVGLLLAQRKLN